MWKRAPKSFRAIRPIFRKSVGNVAAAEAATRRWRPSRRRKRALPDWSALGRGGGRSFCSKRRRQCAAGASNWPPGKSTNAAKSWREADADVGEAIDFCEYYARGAVELERSQEVHVPGEENRLIYVPRGVAVVIAPWNFPLAILTGMTTAALATGNTVIMKPAEQSSVDRRQADGDFPRNRPAARRGCNYLPGMGEVVGAALVEHPDVALIAFTGSRAVGLVDQCQSGRGFDTRHWLRQARHLRNGRQKRHHRR